MTLTEVLPDIANWVSVPLKINGQWRTATNFSVGTVALPAKCGNFIRPTVTYASSCDGTLHTNVTLDASDPAGEVTFDTIDPSGTAPRCSAAVTQLGRGAEQRGSRTHRVRSYIWACASGAADRG